MWVVQDKKREEEDRRAMLAAWEKRREEADGGELKHAVQTCNCIIVGEPCKDDPFACLDVSSKFLLEDGGDYYIVFLISIASVFLFISGITG